MKIELLLSPKIDFKSLHVHNDNTHDLFMHQSCKHIRLNGTTYILQQIKLLCHVTLTLVMTLAADKQN